MPRIYLDYNATTPLDPQVFRAMEPYFNGTFGNPSSFHREGTLARKGLDEARGRVARALGADSEEIFFTSGGTEAANLAIHGLLTRLPDKRHIIASPIEHHCVLHLLHHLEREGRIEISWVPVSREGRIDPDDFRKQIRPETALLILMVANNETGILSPVREVGEIARERGVPIFCDAVQAVGKEPIRLTDLPVDLLSFSAHKIYGPKGVGGLFIRKNLRLSPLIWGGGQEMKMRGGTENVAGIVGLSAALEKVTEGLSKESARERGLRDRLEERIRTIPGAKVFGDRADRLVNTLLVAFEGIESEILLIALDREGIAASSGSACASGTLDPSHVLTAMKFPPKVAKGGIRFSLGRPTTEEEILHLGEILPAIVGRLR